MACRCARCGTRGESPVQSPGHALSRYFCPRIERARLRNLPPPGRVAAGQERTGYRAPIPRDRGAPCSSESAAQRGHPGHCAHQGKSLGVPQERSRGGSRGRNHGRTGTPADARDVFLPGDLFRRCGVRGRSCARVARRRRTAGSLGERITMSMSWEMDYKKRLKTPDEARRCVKSEMRVYIQPGCAEPETLVEALMKRAPELHDVEIVHMMTMGCAPYVAPEMAGHFRHNAMFIGSNVRAAVNDGRADYTPIYLSEIEGLFESGEMPIDVALIEVSPPDSHGFCSFGVGVDTTLTA